MKVTLNFMLLLINQYSTNGRDCGTRRKRVMHISHV